MGRMVAFVVVLVVVSGGATTVAGYGPLADVADELPGAGALPDWLEPGAGGADGGGGGDGSNGGGSGDGGAGGNDGGGDSSGSGDGGGDASGDDAGDGGGGTATAEGPPFAIQVAAVEECGRTCRDVTLRVTNRRDAAATGVTVIARMFAGKRADDGDKLWEGSADLGTLTAGETATVTRRIQLGFVDAGKVKNNDGWVTVRTEVTGDEAGATFVVEKQVA